MPNLVIPGVTIDDSGIYDLIVTNALLPGLFIVSEPFTVNVAEFPPLEIVEITSPVNACGFNISCNGDATGSATVTFTGGQEPFSILWSNGQTTAQAVGLSAGEITVTVTDALNNSATGSTNISIRELKSLFSLLQVYLRGLIFNTPFCCPSNQIINSILIIPV